MIPTQTKLSCCTFKHKTTTRYQAVSAVKKVYFAGIVSQSLDKWTDVRFLLLRKYFTFSKTSQPITTTMMLMIVIMTTAKTMVITAIKTVVRTLNKS